MREFDKHLPSLLDRLTDDEPSKKEESHRGRAIPIAKYRDEVIRDLGWLLNSGSLGSVHDLDDYPLVAESVLNYGLPDLAGLTSSSIDVREVERLLKRAIVAFEPRLLRNSVRVRAIAAEDSANDNSLIFEVAGELWADPMPERLFLKTEVDLETGAFTVAESTDAG